MKSTKQFDIHHSIVQIQKSMRGKLFFFFQMHMKVEETISTSLESQWDRPNETKDLIEIDWVSIQLTRTVQFIDLWLEIVRTMYTWKKKGRKSHHRFTCKQINNWKIWPHLSKAFQRYIDKKQKATKPQRWQRKSKRPNVEWAKVELPASKPWRQNQDLGHWKAIYQKEHHIECMCVHLYFLHIYAHKSQINSR